MKICCECRSPEACQEKGCFVGLIDIPIVPIDPGPPERKRIFRRRQRAYRKLVRERKRDNN